MEQFTPSWLLIFLGLLAILTELIVGVQTGFDLVLLGLALVLGGIVGNWLNNWQIGLLAAAVLAVSYIVLGRRFIKSKLSVITRHTNIDQLIGKWGIVVKEIKSNKAGQVKVGSEVWRAESNDDFALGAKVKIIAIEGVTLKVVKL
ncbi:NfeD family protein [Candidatus Gottesmanbacteria bacterium]|nr:NfeD family protein [Candidatus Gottesmanbacteria bacterium]